jgi:sugar lactone lactonase YvrE
MSLDLIYAVSAPMLLGESPVWQPQEQLLYWVDIPGKRLHQLDPSSGAQRHWDFPCEPTACAPMLGGGLLLAMRDGLWRFDPETSLRGRLCEPPYDESFERFNDGKCDPLGRFWVGTIYEPREPARAALYRWHERRIDRMAGDITVSNGLGWSPDARTMYWSDTKAHTVYAFDFDVGEGTLSRQRVFARFECKQPGQDLQGYGGRPDGAAVDAEGCYWVAMFEGQRLLRLSPHGDVLREVSLPVRCPTMPCFGGSDLRTLYITTSRENRPVAELAEQPLAGCVLSLRVDVPGLPVNYASH